MKSSDDMKKDCFPHPSLKTLPKFVPARQYENNLKSAEKFRRETIKMFWRDFSYVLKTEAWIRDILEVNSTENIIKVKLPKNQ